MNINTFPPGRDLYLKVRGGFISQDSTLTAWCREHNINPTNAQAALVGIWNGPKGKELRAELIKASGIADSTQSLKSAS